MKTNSDDSCGNHDVIAKFGSKDLLGIQVTELTYELWRKRSNQREQFLERITTALQQASVISKVPLVAKICFSAHDPNELNLVPASEVASIIATSVNQPSLSACVTTKFGRVYFSVVSDADIYVPHVGNIGVDVEFDQLPRSFDMYRTAIDSLVDKKRSSISPWLVIWSTAFHLDRHFLGESVLEYMKPAFSKSSFTHVYFIESMDGAGFFEANIKIHNIKVPSCG